MKTPQWLAEKIAETGVQVLDGRMTRTAGDSAIAAAVDAHPLHCTMLGRADGAAQFARWLREHASTGDLFQSALFPDLPAVMRVAPKRSIPVNDMTGEELDHAKNMLWARTENMINGAEESAKREQVAFARLYDKVRPLLTGELTVGDVLDGLMGQAGEA
jgi:hypothetical protein